MLNPINVDWKYIKTFATEANLDKYIAKQAATSGKEHNDRFIKILTPEGRWTAIVRLDTSVGGYLCRYDGLLKI